MSFTNRRDVFTAVAARAVGLLGDELAAMALVLRAQQSGAGAGAVAGLLIAAMAPMVVLAPVAGRLVDRQDSRRLLVGASLAQAVVCTALLTTSSLPLVLGLVALLGAGQAVTATTWQALLPAMAGPEATPRALGLSQSAFAIGGILAPALAGALFTIDGVRLPLMLDVATYLLVALGAGCIATRRVRGVAPGAAVDAHPGEDESDRRGGLAIIWSRPKLRALFVVLGVFITLGAMVNVVEVFLVLGTLHAGAAWYGALGATWSAGMVAGSWFAGRLAPERMSVVSVLSAALLALALAGYSAAPVVAVLVPLAILGGWANGALNVTVTAQVYRGAPGRALGRVSATIGALANGAQITSYLLGGVLAATLTPRTIFALGSVLSLTGLAVTAPSVLRRAPEETATATSEPAYPSTAAA